MKIKLNIFLIGIVMFHPGLAEADPSFVKITKRAVRYGLPIRFIHTDSQTDTIGSPLSFISSLVSQNRSSEIDQALDIYAPFLGSWKMILLDSLDNGRKNKLIGEWHFSRILEGRAIQDVLIAPDRDHRSDTTSKFCNRYGTTLRTFDSRSKKWTINWFNPVSGIHNELLTRVEPGKIIQESKESDGLMMRWVFDNIKTNSFHWYGEGSTDQGRTWTREVEFFGERIRNRE